MLNKIKECGPGVLLSLMIALLSLLLSSIIPGNIIGSSVLALVIGIAINPLLKYRPETATGIQFVSKRVLKLGIVFMGISLSFSQLFMVGKYALLLMVFTLITAFGGGYLLGRLFKVNGKLTSLLSTSTAICGGSAVATLGPVIEAEDRDIAYAISATFLFDLLTVISFPWLGQLLGLTDTSYGLWVGTAVNDTSSVVAAGYGFSEIAGNFAVIVKLTRTLFIVPIVLIFSYIHSRRKLAASPDGEKKKVKISAIFPWFILLFVLMVAVKSTAILPDQIVDSISALSKLFMLMALASIGLKTSFSEVRDIGLKPFFLAVAIDLSVVIVSLLAQDFLQRIL